MDQEIIEPMNKNHRILFTIATVLLTSIVIGSSVFYVMDKQAKEQQRQIEELQKKNEEKSLIKTPELTKEEDDVIVEKGETANWKTYANKQYNFAIKYPSNWIVETKDVYGFVNFLTVDRQEKLKKEGPPIRTFDVSISYYDTLVDLNKEYGNLAELNDENLSFDQWMTKREKGGSFRDLKKIMISGVNGYEGVAIGDGESNVVYLNKGSAIFKIELDREIGTLERDIINSFKFGN